MFTDSAEMGPSALSVNKSLISYFDPDDHPVLHAATAFRVALNVRGVKVGHDSRTKPLPAGATLVATEPSPASHGWCC